METLLLAAALMLPLAAQPGPHAVEPVATVSVPFGCGHSYYVSQAHETGSHLQNDTWAWDFRMPKGTPVVAALDGEVRLARGGSTVGGCDPALAKFANYVVLAHAGGLETQYLHFSEVVVKPGQKVRAGTLIGYSGDTGWACGAHLHFKVARTHGPGWNNPSVQAAIQGYGDPQRDVLIQAPLCSTGERMMASRTPVEAPPSDAPAFASPVVREAAAALLASDTSSGAASATGAASASSGQVIPADAAGSTSSLVTHALGPHASAAPQASPGPASLPVAGSSSPGGDLPASGSPADPAPHSAAPRLDVDPPDARLHRSKARDASRTDGSPGAFRSSAR